MRRSARKTTGTAPATISSGRSALPITQRDVRMNQINLFLLPGLDGTGQLFHPLSANLPEYLVPCLIQYPPDIFLDYNLLVKYARERISTDKPFVLLAESFSGPVALELAASQRCNLVAVILCATFISNPAPRPLSWIGSLLGAMLFKLTPPRFLIRYYLLGQRASEPRLLRQLSRTL